MTIPLKEAMKAADDAIKGKVPGDDVTLKYETLLPIFQAAAFAVYQEAMMEYKAKKEPQP